MSDMATTILTKADVLHWLRREAVRAVEDAEQRLTEDHYYVHGGLCTIVTIRAASEDGQKMSKFYKVGEAVNLARWEADDE